MKVPPPPYEIFSLWKSPSLKMFPKKINLKKIVTYEIPPS